MASDNELTHEFDLHLTEGEVKHPDQTDPFFGHLITAMVTPFTKDDRVDYEAFEALAVKLVDEGNDSLVVSGTTGETSTLEDHEKEGLVRAAKSAVGDRAKVIAGTSTNHTSHDLEMARRAERAGADGQLVVTPYYNKPSQDGVLAHYQAVADAADLPLMIYDIPGRSGIAIETETILRLAEHPHIMSLKDAKNDITATTEVLTKTELEVYSGDDQNVLAWMAMGAVGVVSVTSHVACPHFRRMIDSLLNYDLKEARIVHGELGPVIRGMMTRVQGAVSSKLVLDWLGFPINADVRLPLVQANAHEKELVLADLREAGWNL
ncbi:4-hydroxy-tetrahydrodipicolinate synthase [Nesterenkonia sp. HG001]|uniref:4-hydroxy-tetrahydrodipicolinate synthase n=1 Tax=Nesterenkonia sp. HG001 TaxID=2983207 RepID=UPI002AC68D84|nr:4-hydroxy-tetrahydrodipicolinate synthase [Nesterenkonia sp. HG001]MDZ5076069.1 4-hydroxy-tetrahydrodipicolinate synthase [Nesterenkonia sp. HG001]